ncbi:ATP synthase F1 subunit delta [Plebeiibacterium marinum]|uniref:ATP synthase subunit delta n=1 Tax=Plebeiibacterium marinum TaxID=2992111 RepID=A0AAE3SLD7_9BACT|nr:ATP synthase F1 subunit delta [Plebeiobacterium marinum]MCW3806440.1 ATP synthase F1 subunit delta [Plebeiobacterium marinum]
MDNSLISVRYAKALFSLSLENNNIETIYSDMQLLSEQCSGTPAFCQVLESPNITPAEKKRFFKSTFEKYICETSMNFLNVIVDNKREVLLPSITRNYIDFYKKKTGLKTATIYTAIELSDEYFSKILKLLEKELNAKIDLQVYVKSHLIGGFVLMVDGKMMDASIFNKLKEFKNKLLS